MRVVERITPQPEVISRCTQEVSMNPTELNRRHHKLRSLSGRVRRAIDGMVDALQKLLPASVKTSPVPVRSVRPRNAIRSRERH